MKLLLATALFSTLATGSMAADFDATSFTIEASKGNVIASVTTVDNAETTLGVGVYVFPHSIAGADANVLLSLDYATKSEDFQVAAEYNLSKEVSPFATLYGSLEAAYVDSTNDWHISPTLGAAYAVTDPLSVFAEVSYRYNATNDWAKEGGTVELGVDYALTDVFYVRPSFVQTFDAPSNDVNFALTVGASF